MSGSIDTSDILVVVDRGEQYNVNIQPPDQYGISIKSGDTYIVNIDLPTTVVDTNTTTYYRVSDYATTAATASFFGGVSASVEWNNVLNKPSGLVSASDQISYTNITDVPANILSSSTQINQLANVSASFATTSSYALNAGSGVGFPFSGSAVITGSLLVSGGNISGTASLAQAVVGGKSRYVPLWTGSLGNELTSSIIYQTAKGIFIGYDTTPHVHSAEGETLAVHSGETGVKNVIYAHGTFDDDYRINVRNISSGISASTNYKATSDIGNDVGGFVEMGINSSTYSRTDQIGGPLDAYLYTTGSDLLIGTLSPDKRIILFTGPGDADNNARVYIDSSGSVGINTSEVIANAPDALRVKAVPYVSTYNVITAIGLTDDYAQINMKNTGVGNSVSSDIVATANNGDENTYYVNMGINGETYTGTIGGPNDSYVYSTGGHLHLGTIDPDEEVRLFVGNTDTTLSTKLTLRDTNQHELSGSLNVTGSLNVLEGTVNNLTASYAITASYVAGAASDWDTLLNKPNGLVSSSTQASDWTVLSASFATSASWAPTILPSGIISSSTQVDYNQIQNTPAISATASYVEYTNVANKPTLVSSSTQINTGSFSGSFIGTFVGTSSWASNVTSASFATTASAATSITFVPTTASFAISSSRAVTSSYALTASVLLGSVTSASYALNADTLDGLNSTVFATTGSNTFIGNQTITGSILTTADTLLFTGSIFTSGSLSVVGGVVTASLFGTASRATSASIAITASYIDGGFY